MARNIQNYPDLCLEYLVRQENISNLRIEDLSSLIFDDHFFCYSSEANFGEKKIVGIGTHKDKFKAASICMSEIMESYFLQKFFRQYLSVPLAYSSSFHIYKEEADKYCMAEIVERATLLSLFLEGSHVEIKKISCHVNEIIPISKECKITCYTIEFFKGRIVYYIEIEDRAIRSNGFSYFFNRHKLSLEKSFLEAYRRFKVNYKLSLTGIPTLSVLSNWEKSKKFIGNGHKRLNYCHKTKKVNNIGFFSFATIKDFPRRLESNIEESIRCLLGS